MRVFLLLILIGLVLTTPLSVVFVATCLYAFRYTAYELIVLGALADALYGVGIFPYVYTVSAMLIFVVAELVKPSLSFYDRAT